MVIAGRAERLQALELRLNIVGLQVEVHPFLGDLLVAGALEQHPNLGIWKSKQSPTHPDRKGPNGSAGFREPAWSFSWSFLLP